MRPRTLTSLLSLLTEFVPLARRGLTVAFAVAASHLTTTKRHAAEAQARAEEAASFAAETAEEAAALLTAGYWLAYFIARDRLAVLVEEVNDLVLDNLLCSSPSPAPGDEPAK